MSAAELAKEETALEIGPGKGILTQRLLGRVKRLVAVEIDRSLAEALPRQLAGSSSVRIVAGEVLKQDLDALFSVNDYPVKLLGNLPYAITAPIFEKILAWPRWRTGVFLVQKEVAERMRSKEGSRVYGVLSLAVQLFATVEIILAVPPSAFRPPPEVHSCVIRVRRKAQAELPPEATPSFFDLVRGAFAHRRKTIANSLALHSSVDKKILEKWLAEQAVLPSARAENISLNEYVRLAPAWRIFRRETGI